PAAFKQGMTVIADSSVLNYLILIEAADVLQQLFKEIIIPEAVAAELQRPKTPAKVATWMAQRPDWLRINTPATSRADKQLEKLGAGEREAIALALIYFPEVLLLLDDQGKRGGWAPPNPVHGYARHSGQGRCGWLG